MPVVSLIFRALVFIDLIIFLLNMILYIVGVYQMLKCAMEKIQRIETRLQLPPNKPLSSERLVLHDASNAYSPPPLNIWTSQENLEGSFSGIDDSLEKQEVQKMLITPAQVVLKYKAFQVFLNSQS